MPGATALKTLEREDDDVEDIPRELGKGNLKAVSILG